MRPIDADALFDVAFKVWGDEADAGETNLFMEMINNAPTIAPPPNAPLTLEELREMDGEPVWIFTRDDSNKSFLAIVNTAGEEVESYARVELFEYYEMDWLAYRRKPEEGERL